MTTRPEAYVAGLALTLCVHGAIAAPDPLYTEAVQEYRAGRWSSAFGRFITLANNGHVDAARIALFMQLHGRQLYGSDWDASDDDVALWSRMTGARMPQQVERVASSSASQSPPWRARMTRFVARASSSPSAVPGACHAGKCQ
ncbi:hypothetical protein WG902_14685 [Ramlibacter sp. PS3R-8]|uniref:hypothetical protein n=1 Tax=Ramlibacter sp. PS3R-8 TaxID=3133437 RepID=UPI00309BCA38